MEVVSGVEVCLSHAEVLHFLKEEQKAQGPRAKAKTAGSLATLRLELISALESSPASKQLSRAAEGLGDLNSWRAQLKRFNLTPAEELTVLNQCPRRPVEVHLLIENSEERLSEQDVDDLVKVVKDMLGEEDEEQEEEDEEGGGDGEEEEEGQQEQEEQGESQ